MVVIARVAQHGALESRRQSRHRSSHRADPLPGLSSMHARVEPAAAVARTEVLNPSTAPERQRAKDELRPVVWPRTGGESGRFHRLQLGCPATPIPPWDGRRGADGNPGSVGYRQPAAHHLDNIDPDPAPVNARTSSAVPRPGRCRALQVRSPTSEILLPPGIALLAPAPIVGTLHDPAQLTGRRLLMLAASAYFDLATGNCQANERAGAGWPRCSSSSPSLPSPGWLYFRQAFTVTATGMDTDSRGVVR